MANPIDYTSRDFAGTKESLLAYASQVFPGWTSRSEGDFGMLMVELFAYMADIQSYYADRVQQESYISTATQRLALLQLAQLLGYTPHGPIPAVGQVQFVTDNPGPAVIVPAGTQVITDFVEAIDGPVVYEVDADTTVAANGGTAMVNVTQGITQAGVALATSTGLPSQEYRIPSLSVIDGSVQIFVSSLWGPESWTFIPYLVDAGPDDKVWTSHTDAQGQTWVTFGDGVTGQIPPLGTSITTTYRIGGGIIGNVAAGVVNSLASTVEGASIGVDGAGNPVSTAMVGGADPESNDSIRTNAPMAYRTQQRAVTLADFVSLALSVPGVTIANAVANHYTNVTLYVAGPNGQVPSVGLKNEVAAFFSSRSLAGVSLSVVGPSIVPINFGSSGSPLVIQVKSNFSRSAVTAQVTNVLQRFFAPSNISFGMNIALSAVYEAVQAIPGVANWSVSFMARSDSAQVANTWIQLRDNELPTIGAINISASGGVT